MYCRKKTSTTHIKIVNTCIYAACNNPGNQTDHLGEFRVVDLQLRVGNAFTWQQHAWVNFRLSRMLKWGCNVKVNYTTV